MSNFETIRLEVEDGIATLTLNRPDKLNAFNTQMMQEMIAAFDQTDADDSVRVVIVTGAGRAFCAGADLSAGAATFDYSARGGEEKEARTIEGVQRDGGGLLTLRIYDSLKPVIAAVNGPAVGVGVTTASRAGGAASMSRPSASTPTGCTRAPWAARLARMPG